mgnify:CR=1 FL=1
MTDLICIVEGGNSLHVTVLEIHNDANLPSFEDLEISVLVETNGFVGHNSSIGILRDDFMKFASDLLKLEQSRQGRTVLKSMSPDDLNLSIESISRLGHMYVSGTVGKWCRVGPKPFMSSVGFGFEIEPTLLVDLSRSDLVQKYSKTV